MNSRALWAVALLLVACSSTKEDEDLDPDVPGAEESDADTDSDTDTDTDSDTDADADTDADTDADSDTDADTDADADADTDADPLSCYDVPAEDCAASGCLEITGWPIASTSDGGYCVDTAAAQVVGCMPSDTGCGAALTHATQPEGEACWGFPDTCTPRGWGNGCRLPEMETWEDCR